MEDAAKDTDANAQAATAEQAAEQEIAATVEAILFATDSPISPAKIAQTAELPGRREVKRAVDTLNDRYEQMGCAFRIEPIAGGYQMLTLPEYRDVVSRLFRSRSEMRLSQAAMETLAVVAYRQPVLRADVEAIRGVACGEVLRGLMEKHLVKIVGRAEVLGRPMLYGTTKRFLEVFGLQSLKELPKVEELRGGARQIKAPQEDEPAAEEEQPTDDEGPGPAGEESPPREPPPADPPPDASPPAEH
jgi:segregation and condensation protein B